VNVDLGSVPLFAGLPPVDIARLSEGITERRLASGDLLFEEGDAADDAYVITSGDVEILKDSADRRVRIAITGPGDVIGEMALLTEEARNATARALTDVTLFAIPRGCLEEVLSTSVEANRALFSVFISRWREQESRVRHSERMAQLGVLTAGLAHEMNNPAAAVSSGAQRLGAVIDRQLAIERTLPDGVVIPQPSDPRPTLSTMARADREEEIEALLERLGVSRAWELTGPLVDSGYTVEDLDGVDPSIGDVVARAAAGEAEIRDLVAGVAEGAERLSALVSALKSYSYLDQAPVQEVDVVKGIEDTLLILRPKTKDIGIVRDYDEALPTIVAYGSQLNQVWTNLIDNAADAIRDAGVEDGEITIRTRLDDDHVVVEIGNNGPPIPPAILDRIFEAFFTTKEPGKGTGLGLDTAYSIVVTQHRGSLDVVSTDEATVFTVTLPLTQGD
jgi:signal transduction histidine kinase